MLYVVATPIGNLKDITYRAIEILKNSDIIACEDTRRSRKLLNAYDISKPLISCYARKEDFAAQQICALLEDGKTVAYISDAGTPGLSDPGTVLVQKVKENGFPVNVVPGPSAFAALCSVSGFPGKSVTFEGFLSPKAGRRRKRLGELVERKEAFVIFESPARIIKLLNDLADICPNRKILLGREMTKIYEEYIEATAKQMLEILLKRELIKGEMTILVSSEKKH